MSPTRESRLEVMRGLLLTAIGFLRACDLAGEDLETYKERHAGILDMANNLISEDYWGSALHAADDPEELKVCKIVEAISALELGINEIKHMEKVREKNGIYFSFQKE